MTCKRERELLRAAGAGLDARGMAPGVSAAEWRRGAIDANLAAHIESCASCRAAWQELDAALRFARELPVDVPSSSHREEVRTALLAMPLPMAIQPRRRRRVSIMIGASVGLGLAAVAAAAVAIVVVAPHVPEHVAHGTIYPHARALVATTSQPPDEVARLRDGTIDVEVSPLAPGERFRVVVGDGEVEVRGTAFSVTADRDHLVAVNVVHGRVEVRPAGQPTTVLHGGESWHPPEVTAAAPPAVVVERAQVAAPAPIPMSPRVAIHRPPSPVVVPGHRPSPQLQPAPRPADALAYDAAWAALRSGDFRGAADAFGRGLELAPDGALADDARYWRAVSLARLAKSAQSSTRAAAAAAAVTAFRDVCDGHASSHHRGEASAMLGWMLVDARDLSEAERRFKAAIDDSNAEVRASARAGLDALAKHPR